MKTNYQRGAQKERRIMNRFRDKGQIAFRSAGSHSPIDIIAIDTEHKVITLIQSKLGKRISGKERAEVLSHKDIEGDYKVIFQLWENRNQIT